MSISYPPSIRPFLISGPRHHVFPNASFFKHKQPFCWMMAHYRPQVSLPNPLKRFSCRMALLYQTRPTSQSLSCTNFWCWHMPLQLRDKSDFIPELTINAQRLRAKSVQHPLFPLAIRQSLRSDPNPSSSIPQAQIFKWRTTTKFFR
jgi:hypothetical protein